MPNQIWRGDVDIQGVMQCINEAFKHRVSNVIITWLLSEESVCKNIQ